MTAFHYTPSYRAAMILRCGEILPTAQFAIPGAEGWVWFTTSQKLDPTATTHSNAAAMLTGERFMVRFGIPADRTTPFKDMKISGTARRKLIARAKGAEHWLWRGARGGVQVGGLTIEWNRGGMWEPVSAETLLELTDGWPSFVAA
jgi:hypothetical protein